MGWEILLLLPLGVVLGWVASAVVVTSIKNRLTNMKKRLGSKRPPLLLALEQKQFGLTEGQKQRRRIGDALVASGFLQVKVNVENNAYVLTLLPDGFAHVKLCGGSPDCHDHGSLMQQVEGAVVKGTKKITGIDVLEELPEEWEKEGALSLLEGGQK